MSAASPAPAPPSGDDRGPALRAYTITWMVLPAIALVLRFWSRALSTSSKGGRSKFWWDDWTALLALPATYASHGVQLHLISVGLGKHVNELSTDRLLLGLKLQFCIYFVYNLSITLTKTSVLFFYARIFSTQSRPFKWALWISQGLVWGWFVAICLVTVFMCNPVNKQWIPSVEGTCRPIGDLWLGSAIPSVIIDVIILVLPLPLIWKLRLKKSRKILVSGVFVCGYSIIVISLGRLITITGDEEKFAKDLTWEAVPSLYWLTAEAPVSIISICLPSIFFLVRRFVKDGPASLFTSRSATSRAHLARDSEKSGENSIPRNYNSGSGSMEKISNKQSSDSSHANMPIYAGPGQQHYHAQVGKASSLGGHSKPGSSAGDQYPSIHVKNEVRVQSEEQQQQQQYRH
jgi:hypothetical protein